MTRHRAFQFVTLLTLSTLGSVAGGCANGSSPTEPVSFDEPIVTKSSSSPATAEGSLSAAADESKRRGRGGDDQPGDDRGNGRGRGGRGGNANRPEDRPRASRAGQEFEGAVVSVDGNRLTLAGGVRVVVNGQTQWSARGDLFTLDQVAGSVASGAPTRVEGRGTRQADRSFLAQTIKAEVDN
jgi:hypothetical protein